MFVFCNSVSANPLLVKRIGVHLQDYTQQATQNGMVSFNSSSSFFLRKNESYLSPVCSSSSSLQNGWWPAALLCVGIFRSLVMFLKQEEEKAQLSKERRGGHRCWEKQDMDKNWSEATWTKMVEDSTFSRLCASLYAHYNIFSSVQFSSLAQSCPTLFDPMNRSTPGLPVHHKLPEFTQIHVHWVSDAMQPSHPLLSPSPPAPNPSQHQGLFQRVNSSHEVAKVLEFQLQHQSFQWTPGIDLL